LVTSSIMGIIGSYVMSTLPLNPAEHQGEKRLQIRITSGCAVIQDLPHCDRSFLSLATTI